MTRRRDLLMLFGATGVLLAVPAAAKEAGAPFSIHTRPMPAGEDLKTLLPAQVGPFTRDALPQGAKLKSDEDLNVTYRSGKDTVNFGLSKPETVDDAREAVKVSREEAIASKVPMRDARYSIKTDPAYFQAGDFIAWTRGSYFMYAKASSAEALARFMAAFPY